MEEGRFPPSVCYIVLYTSPDEIRQTPAFLKVSVAGANVDLIFNCRIMQEKAGKHVFTNMQSHLILLIKSDRAY